MARRKWIDPETQQVLPAAFIRRPEPKDEDGLSVDIESPISCAASLRDCFGVASLHVGRIRGLGLDVEVDSPPHANIVGVPREMEDVERMEWLASQLAKQSRLVPPA
jgi:hypothetical protein